MIDKKPTIRNKIQLFRNTYNYLFVPANDPRHIRILLGIITLIAVVLRLYRISDPIGYDEAYTFINFSSKSFKFVLADYHAPNNHILNSLFIGIVYRIFGNHLWIVRVPAFIAGVLGVPASFIAARRFFTAQQSLAASAVLAIAPNIIASSVNGRGYTLIILFSLLLLNFSGILVKEQRRSAMAAYAITGALGFYSIPIFLYPMAGISLWVVATYILSKDSWRTKWIHLRNFLVTCTISGALIFLLYSPVIIFGTGLDSIISNEIVKPQSWIGFRDNLLTRSSMTWDVWIAPYDPLIRHIILLGFLLSVLLYRKLSNQKTPMQIFMIIAVGVLLVAQRVTPLPRIWSYLEMFYLFFAATGLTGVGHLIFKILKKEQIGQTALSGLVFLSVIFTFTNVTFKTQNRAARLNRTIAPEKFAADFLAEHLTGKDTIIAVAPTDIQTAYYLKINGIPYDFFYQRDHPVEIQNTMVLVRTREEYGINTLEKVLGFFKLVPSLDMDAGQQVFNYGPLFIYSIPAK